MRRAALLLVVTGVVGLSAMTPAIALEPRQCLPMAEMNVALRAEGQRRIIIGNRVAIVDDRSRPAGARADLSVNTFTSNEDGSLGYNLEGNRPMGEPSSEVCIRAKLTAIRLFDIRRPGTPPEARRGGEFDRNLAGNEALGTRPMLQAQSISTGPDGAVRQGLGVTLLGNATRRAAWLIANHPNGAFRDMFQMGDTGFTEVGLSRLR